MTAYAVAHMRQVKPGPQIVEYPQKIDATLEPFGDSFLVHGGDVEVIENDWPGHLIVIEFPIGTMRAKVPFACLPADPGVAHR